MNPTNEQTTPSVLYILKALLNKIETLQLIHTYIKIICYIAENIRTKCRSGLKIMKHNNISGRYLEWPFKWWTMPSEHNSCPAMLQAVSTVKPTSLGTCRKAIQIL